MLRSFSRRAPLRLAPGLLIAALATPVFAQEAPATAPAPAPLPIATYSVLTFAPDGTLFVGDARGGALFAIDIGPRTQPAKVEAVTLGDVETKVAALIGTRADDVVIHDMAADPISYDIYLAVSRNRGKWRSQWHLPNDLGDATELLRIDQQGRLHGVDLAGRPFTSTQLPRLLAPGRKHEFKPDVDPRTEAITDLAWDDGTLWVSGLSNEEFSSAIWRVPYPFSDEKAAITTLEIYHVAHQAWETAAPVRTLVPLTLGGKKHVLAAYLCTPLVLFEADQLKDGQHVKGRTIAEFGAGNYPLDMVLTPSKSGGRVFLANSALPMLVVQMRDIEKFEGALTEPAGAYLAGLRADYRAGGLVQQLDKLGDGHLLLLRRIPSGALELETWQLAP
jgi:hypothetical protein